MKKLFFLILLFSGILHATIDERKSDVYFANGIDTDKASAEDSLRKIKTSFQTHNPTAYNSIANWDTVYNHTHGIGIDLYESMLQKIYEDAPGDSFLPFVWNVGEVFGFLDYTFKGIVERVAKKYTKEATKEYSQKAAKTLAKKAAIAYNKKYGKKLVEADVEAMFNYVFDNLIDEAISHYVTQSEEEILQQEQQDFQTHRDKYYKSVKDGHGVIIIAHSQGNLFVNRAYNSFGSSYDASANTEWVKQYIQAMGVATPANNLLGKTSPYITFDNDMIQLVPDSLAPNTTNPKHYTFKNAVNETIDNIYSMEAHAFLSSYMAAPATSNAILGFINNAIFKHNFTPSQWEKSEELGCGCDKRIYVEHKHDTTLTSLMNEVDVVAFEEELKLYPIEGKYYKGSYEGDSVKDYTQEKRDDDLCMELLDFDKHAIDEFLGKVEESNPNSGAIEVTLSWSNGLDYDLELAMPSSVKDVESCSMEHAYVESEYQIYPGTYAVNVTKVTQQDTNGTYYLSIKTPGESKLLEVDAGKDGHIADIYVKYVDDKPVVVLQPKPVSKILFSSPAASGGGGGGGGGSSGGGRSDGGGSSYSSSSGTYYDTPIGYSCGHRPCEYWITEYVAMAMAGPLSGADVALYSLDGFKTNTSLYQGKTSSGNTLYTAGKLNIPKELIETLDDDVLYVIAVYGGEDVDADDDMYVDAIPTTNHGTLHAFITGKQLKELQPKVNILTEVAYQVLKESIQNDSLTKEQILEKLQEIAEHLLLSKVYSSSAEPLGSTDLLEWMPTIHRQLLHAEYETQVEPIVHNLLLGQDISQSAYDLVYNPHGVIPILKSSIYSVMENAQIGEKIGDVVVQHEGKSALEEMQLYGEESENFSINKQGNITLTASLDYEKKQLYKLFVRAKNADGYSKYTALYIEVVDVIDAPYAVSFDFENIYANAAVGTKVGAIVFEEGSSAISAINLGGADSDYFRVDTNGTLRTNKELEDFFVKKAYSFDIVAKNSSGASLPANVIINIGDRRDIPLVSSVSANINENSPAGTVIAKVSVISDGDSPIISYALSDTTQFIIDNNGTISVAQNAVLDYETQHSVRLSVIASNIIGDSRPQDVVVYLNDIIDVAPTLRDVNLTINLETAPSTVIGNILQNPGDSVITLVKTSIESPFNIDANGDISIVSSLFNETNDFFSLEVEASNSFGVSNKAMLNVTLITTPVLHDITLKAFDNSTALTQIGKLPIIKNGNNIQSISLSGNGSSDFTVDTEGVIRVAQGITLQASRQDYYNLTVLINKMYEATLTINVHHRIIGSFDTPSYARDVIISADNTKAYIADDASGLQIVDITNPTTPMWLSSFNTPDRALSLTLSKDENKIYVADWGSGLQLLDISDPITPTYLSSFNTSGYACDVTLLDNDTKAYVADYSAGIQIIDISNSLSLTRINSFKTISQALHISTSSSNINAYIATNGSPIQVINIINPSVPIGLGVINVLATEMAISETQKIAYVLESSQKLTILDISDLTFPIILSSINLSTYAHNIFLSEDETKAYIANGAKGLKIVDISDPTSPIVLATIDTPSDAQGIALSRDNLIAYVADYESGLQIIDVSGLEVTQKVPTIRGFSGTAEAALTEGSLVGTVKVYYAGSSGITSFRLEGERAEDFAIDIQGNITLAKPLQAVANNIYTLKAVATNSIGEREADVTIRVHSVPEISPFTVNINSMSIPKTLVGKLDMLSDDNTTISYIALSGEGSENFRINTSGEIYVSEEAELHHFVKADYELEVTAINSYGSNTFKIFIHILETINKWKTSDGFSSVILSKDDNTLFIGDYWKNLTIADVTTPLNLIPLKTISNTSNTERICMSSDSTTIYLAKGWSGVQIIDISNLFNPTILASMNIDGYAQDITTSQDGTKLYVNASSKLIIIDITDPSSPITLSSISMPATVAGIAISPDGTKAYVANFSYGLQIIDINDSYVPTILSSYNTTGYAYKVKLSSDGTTAYVADGTAGLQIIDVSNPLQPILLSSFDTLGDASNVTISKDNTKAFVTDGNQGLHIIDITNPNIPMFLTTIKSQDYIIDIQLSTDETKAFIIDGEAGLHIVDLTGL